VQSQVLVASKSIQFPTSFATGRLAFTQVDGTPQLWTVPIETNGGALTAGKPERVLATEFHEADGALSPDGRWLAYVSNRSGSFEVYVKATSAPDNGPGFPVSNGGGSMPQWSPNGRELLYAEGDRIMAVSYRVNDRAFVAEKATLWATSAGTISAFDVAPGGARVLVASPVAARGTSRPEHTVVFVQNFFDELRRLAPVGK
jgi:Tol biopolymer transport system component